MLSHTDILALCGPPHSLDMEAALRTALEAEVKRSEAERRLSNQAPRIQEDLHEVKVSIGHMERQHPEDLRREPGYLFEFCAERDSLQKRLDALTGEVTKWEKKAIAARARVEELMQWEAGAEAREAMEKAEAEERTTRRIAYLEDHWQKVTASEKKWMAIRDAEFKEIARDHVRERYATMTGGGVYEKEAVPDFPSSPPSALSTSGSSYDRQQTSSPPSSPPPSSPPTLQLSSSGEFSTTSDPDAMDCSE